MSVRDQANTTNIRKISALIAISAVLFLSTGCGQAMKSVIAEKVPALKRLNVGTYDLGEFKNGQSTPYRILPSVDSNRCTVGFKTIPETRQFNIVIDDGRVFKVDNDDDLKKLADIRLDEQSFYLEFRQDTSLFLNIP